MESRDWVQTHKHRATGNEYMIIGVAETAVAGDLIVVFKDINGKFKAFSLSEFAADFVYVPSIESRGIAA